MKAWVVDLKIKSGSNVRDGWNFFEVGLEAAEGDLMEGTDPEEEVEFFWGVFHLGEGDFGTGILKREFYLQELA